MVAKIERKSLNPICEDSDSFNRSVDKIKLQMLQSLFLSNEHSRVLVLTTVWPKNPIKWVTINTVNNNGAITDLKEC